jgi:hypothetical protein
MYLVSRLQDGDNVNLFVVAESEDFTPTQITQFKLF